MAVLETLDEARCLELIAGHDVGRIGYTSFSGVVIVPVNYRLIDQVVWFRSAAHGVLGTDLDTGIANADYLVAFEVDQYDRDSRSGWSVLIQGAAHRISEPDGLAAAALVDPWPPGAHDLLIRITPKRVTGRQVTQS